MRAACGGTGVAWLRVESRQGIVRRNGIKSVPQGWKSSPMSSQSELTKCVPLEQWRDSFPSPYQRVPKYSKCHDDMNSENARILIPEILASLTLIGNVSSELR
jgi:hypothetical protein